MAASSTSPLPCRARRRTKLQHLGSVAGSRILRSGFLSQKYSGARHVAGCSVDRCHTLEIIPFSRGPGVSRVRAPEGAPPVVILPGFGNCSDDYMSALGNSSASLCDALRRRGFETSVAQVERRDWLRVARGLVSPGFWAQKLTCHPGYSWYLERVRAAVAAASAAAGGAKVILVGHSAGGWLGRAFLGDPHYFVGGAGESARPGTASVIPNPAVRAIVTLGTPQTPALPGKGKGFDRTGGAQAWVTRHFPGARYAEDGVAYVCACGETVVGRRRADRRAPRRPPSYAHDAYLEVCGQGDGVVGDGVVPLQSAFLKGAQNVTLPGVWHSMSRLGTFGEATEHVWYGSEDVVDAWLSALVGQIWAPAQGNGLNGEDRSRTRRRDFASEGAPPL